MTEFIVSTAPITFENLEWDLTPPEGGYVISGTLKVAALTQAQHFPNGYIPSGMCLSLATGGAHSGFLIPYLNAATAGQGDVNTGILRASVPVTRQNGVNRTFIGVSLLVHGIVSASKLPFTVGNAAAGGYLDATGRTDLPLIYWAA
jgi:hypothetical protein